MGEVFCTLDQRAVISFKYKRYRGEQAPLHGSSPREPVLPNITRRDSRYSRRPSAHRYRSATESRQPLDPCEDGAVLWLCRPRRPGLRTPAPAALRTPVPAAPARRPLCPRPRQPLLPSAPRPPLPSVHRPPLAYLTLGAPAATLSTMLPLEGNAEEGTAVSLLYCLQLSLNLQLPQRLKI